MTAERMKTAQIRLVRLAEALEHAIKEEEQYRVPIVFDTPHDDNVRVQQDVWAKSVAHATNIATRNSHGDKSSDVDGVVVIIGHTPEFTDEMIDAILALPEPL